MFKYTINLNTYLNITIALILTFFGYVGSQYEKRFDKFESRFDKFEHKLDQLIVTVNEIKVQTVRTEEKQNYLDSRVQKLETAVFNIVK